MIRKYIIILKIIKYISILILSYPLKLNSKYRNIWIIAERGYDARDNSLHLFNFIMNQKDKPNIYYIINKESEDYKNISEYSNIIYFGSLKHWIYFSLSKVKISTHILGYSPDINLFAKLSKFKLVFGKKIFLQHGIIYNNFPALHYPNVSLDLFVCGAKDEFEYVSRVFGHPKNVVKYLGLCRYDKLSINQESTENIVLVMPSWRSYLANIESQEEFVDSYYYRKYNSLINSKEINKILIKTNYKLVFYPHYETQKFINTFKSEFDRVIIANKTEYDVQTLLKKSKILITDFSSVFFDFTFMKKPVLFFHFDSDESYRKSGYLNLYESSFGVSCPTETKLIEEVSKLLTKEPMEYKNKTIDEFFELRDSKNCSRVYEEILKLI